MFLWFNWNSLIYLNHVSGGGEVMSFIYFTILCLMGITLISWVLTLFVVEDTTKPMLLCSLILNILNLLLILFF